MKICYIQLLLSSVCNLLITPSLSSSPHWELFCLARWMCVFPFQHSLSHFLLFEVHNFAAAVQSSGSCGTRLGGTPRHHSIWLNRRPRHLQHGDNALCAAAGHHRADAQRTHAPTGEANRQIWLHSLSVFLTFKKKLKFKFSLLQVMILF